MATLEQIVAMGFSEDAAKAAVEAHGNGALDMLLGVTPAEASHQVRLARVSTPHHNRSQGPHRRRLLSRLISLEFLYPSPAAVFLRMQFASAVVTTSYIRRLDVKGSSTTQRTDQYKLPANIQAGLSWTLQYEWIRFAPRFQRIRPCFF